MPREEDVHPCPRYRANITSAVPRLIFSPQYVVDIGDHVFPTKKFQLVADIFQARSSKESAGGAAEFIDPGLAMPDDIKLAHTDDWVERVMGGQLTLDEERMMELPWSDELAAAHSISVAGTILACRHALEAGVGIHVGGGSHHAFPGHAEGFCVFNDIACGILKMQREKKIRRAAVVDLDVHQGNGTNAIFQGHDDVMTFSMHQSDIYPLVKTPGTIDIDLKAGTGDALFLETLAARLPNALDWFKPELVVYQAGVDCYEHDLLGGLKITKDGMRFRDEFVFQSCFDRRIPVAVTLGGGYSEDLNDTVELHAQTIERAIGTLGRFGKMVAPR